MKALISLLLFLPTLAFADVSVPRAKQYAWASYDVARDSGASVSHPIGLSVPAGAIITNAWLYINTQFAASGTESLGISCAGSQDFMAYNSVKNIQADRMLASRLSAQTFDGSGAPLAANAGGAALNLSQGFVSVPSACGVSFDVRGASGYTPYTGGKATLILEYFRL